MVSAARSLLSIVGRELFTRPRHRGFYATRVVLGLLALLVLGLGMKGEGWRMGGTIGLAVFKEMSMAMLIVTYLAAPWWAAHGMMEEKEQRTLAMLWLTDFRPSHILAGKLASSILQAILAAMVLVPLLMLCVVFGGVSASQILYGLAVLASLAVLGAGIGLFAATLARTERQMAFLLPALAIGWYVVVPLGALLAGHLAERYGYAEFFGGTWRYQSMGASSALIAMRRLGADIATASALGNIGFNLAAGLGLTGLSGLWLRRALEADDRPPLLQRLKARWLGAARAPRRHPPLRGNPVLWRDHQIVYGGTRRGAVKTLLTLAFLFLAIWGVWFWVSWQFGGFRGTSGGPVSPLDVLFDEEFWNIQLGVQIWVCLLVLVGTSVSLCSRTLNREKRARAVEGLLTTTLTDEQIILGKIGAIGLQLLPWAAAMAVLLALVFSIHGLPSRHDMDGIFMGIAYLLSLWFGYSAFALWSSSRFRRNIGFFLAILVYMVWNVVAPMTIAALNFLDWLPGVSFDILFSVHIAAHLGLGIGSLALLYGSFRANLLR